MARNETDFEISNKRILLFPPPTVIAPVYMPAIHRPGATG